MFTFLIYGCAFSLRIQPGWDLPRIFYCSCRGWPVHCQRAPLLQRAGRTPAQAHWSTSSCPPWSFGHHCAHAINIALFRWITLHASLLAHSKEIQYLPVFPSHSYDMRFLTAQKLLQIFNVESLQRTNADLSPISSEWWPTTLCLGWFSTFFSRSSSLKAFLLFMKYGRRRKSTTSPSPLIRAQNTGVSLEGEIPRSYWWQVHSDTHV